MGKHFGIVSALKKRYLSVKIITLLNIKKIKKPPVQTRLIPPSERTLGLKSFLSGFIKTTGGKNETQSVLQVTKQTIKQNAQIATPKTAQKYKSKKIGFSIAPRQPQKTHFVQSKEHTDIQDMTLLNPYSFQCFRRNKIIQSKTKPIRYPRRKEFIGIKTLITKTLKPGIYIKNNEFTQHKHGCKRAGITPKLRCELLQKFSYHNHMLQQNALITERRNTINSNDKNITINLNTAGNVIANRDFLTEILNNMANELRKVSL